MLRNAIISALVVFSSFFIVAAATQPALADTTDNGFNVCTTGGAKTDFCKEALGPASKKNPVIEVIKVAIQIVAAVLGVTAVIVIILSGLRFITSRGDPNNIKRARDGLLYALVGIILAVLAQAIVSLVLSKL